MKSSDIKTTVSRWLRWMVFVLSAALIVFISIDTFENRPFLSNPIYMRFQLWVCVAFILEFFTQMALAPRHWHFFCHNFLFLLVSVPYLNIVTQFDISLSEQELYFVRFVPLLRAAFAMALVVRAVSTSRIVGIFWAYVSIILLGVYFSSLIFFEQEAGVNPDITDYWSSLWWCSLEATTIGAPINPVTVAGKILAAVLSAMGVIMFPLFTVYLGDMVKRYIDRNSAKNTIFAPRPHQTTAARK